MPRPKQPCKRCDSKVAGQHEPQCRYAKIAKPTVAAPRQTAPAKIRKRVFVIDHPDGETTVMIVGPAGAVKCSSTEQSVQVWTGEATPQPATAAPPAQIGRGRVVAQSTDVSRSGEEYTVTDELNDVPGGMLGLTDEEAMNPDAILERMRRGMIGRMSSETASSDVLLIPEGN